MKTYSFKNCNVNSLDNPNIKFFHFRKWLQIMDDSVQ